MIQPCSVCARPCRPPRTTAAEYPGTVVMAIRVMCHRCYKQGKEPPVTPAAADSPDALALSRYLADRRRRGVPSHGLRVGGDASV